jgi:metal-sulfur cluster biosynthetic enzyme
MEVGAMAKKKTDAKPAALALDEKSVWEALKRVIDPELQISVVDLGLIYKVEVDKKKGEVYVQMTMTSPACPMAGMIEESARSHISQLPDVKNVIVEVVFDPPWSIEKMNPDVRASIGL